LDDLPRQLADFARPPGVIKADYTDFVVEEVPLYPTDGVGSHTYFLVEKAGLTTQQAVRDIARALNVARHEIGFAGLKDARAVTRQWMSVEHIDPERVARLDIPRLRILQTARHTNKLRLGHLKGNRFVIRVRQTATDRLAELQAALERLARLGVPNYFGVQRFGYRGDTWRVGRAIVRGDVEEAIDLILGRPDENERGRPRRARELYDRGEYAGAAKAWPRLFHTERRAAKVLARTGGDRRRAFASIEKSTRSFYISAYQSHLFNTIVARRLPVGLDRLLTGDLAWLHASGAVFRVNDAAAEQPRADRFEISPTGPLFGYRMTPASGEPGRMETELLASEGLAPDAFRNTIPRTKGGRRPVRYQAGETQLLLGADGRGSYLELRCVLPRGCYATALLRELFELVQPGGDEAPDASGVD